MPELAVRPMTGEHPRDEVDQVAERRAPKPAPAPTTSAITTSPSLEPASQSDGVPRLCRLRCAACRDRSVRQTAPRSANPARSALQPELVAGVGVELGELLGTAGEDRKLTSGNARSRWRPAVCAASTVKPVASASA